MVETIDVTSAVDLVRSTVGFDVTRVTIITWVKKYGLGKKLGGRFRIDKIKLMDFLKGVDIDSEKKVKSRKIRIKQTIG